MVKRCIKWLFPDTIREIEEDIHQLYKSMGIEFEYVIPPVNLPDQPLTEGDLVAAEMRLGMFARPKVGVLKDVRIW